MAIETCHGCGVEKDRTILEMYPYREDSIDTEEPVTPLFDLDCQPTADDGVWKQVTVCHQCIHRLSPDMWIDQRGWETLNPTTPFESLPDLKNRV